MTWPEIYNQLKYWIPLTTVCTMIYRAYRQASKSITDWADKLMSNHLTDIQAATERSAVLLEEVRDNQISQGVKVDLVAIHSAKVASDLEKHEQEDGKVQRDILTTLEVLKDRS